MMCRGKTLGSKTKRKLATIRDNIPTQYVKMRRRRIHDTKIVTTCQNEKFKVEEKNEQGRKKRRRKKKRDVSALLTQITVQKKNVK